MWNQCGCRVANNLMLWQRLTICAFRLACLRTPHRDMLAKSHIGRPNSQPDSEHRLRFRGSHAEIWLDGVAKNVHLRLTKSSCLLIGYKTAPREGPAPPRRARGRARSSQTHDRGAAPGYPAASSASVAADFVPDVPNSAFHDTAKPSGIVK